MAKNFDYNGALESGYTDEEILPFLREQHPNFDYESANESGYSSSEINKFLSTYKPERSNLEKAGRIGAQYGLGILQGTNAGIAYDVSTLPLASKEAQNIPYRETLGEDLERLMEQKASGQWDEQDQKLLEHIEEQIKDPRKSMENVQTGDVSIRGLAEKATGIDLEPEGFLEHAAQWAGFVKNKRNIVRLGEFGLNPKDAIKALSPTGSEALRGLGAGTAFQMAKDGDLGPIGTMAAVVIGDLIGAGTAGVAKTGKRLVTEPKKFIAETFAKFTPKDKLKLQKEIIEDFRESGLQADVGTLTDSNLIKWTQSRLAQSGLTGNALEEFKNTLTKQIQDEYKVLADSLGEAKYASNFEAGQSLKEGMTKIRDQDLSETRKIYKKANESLNDRSYVDSKRITNSIEELEKSLKPGKLKSQEQQKVLEALDKIKSDVYDSAGNPRYSNVKDLINNKIALNDIINYETQGGAKQLLKNVVNELDRAIISHGRENASFAKNYINANKRFSTHAKTFRNRNVSQILKSENPEKLISQMENINGIRSLKNILSKSPEGKEIFERLKRMQFDKIIGKNLVDSTTQQIKLGTFSKLLEKGKNREIIKEILEPKTFQLLEKLQKNSGRLADSVNRFYNASKSGAVAADAAILAKGISDIGHLMYGNPWPLFKTAGSVAATRKLSNLITDPEFLKLLEDAILNIEKQGQRARGTLPTISKSSSLSGRPNIRSPQSTPSGLAPSLSPGNTAGLQPILGSKTSKRAPVPSNSITRQISPSALTGPSKTLGSIDASSNRMITQSYNNINEIYKNAELVKPEFEEMLKNISENPGVELKGVRLKNKNRSINKIKQGRDPDTIADYLAGRLIFDDEAALNKIIEEMEQTKIIEIDDFLENTEGKGGYRAIHYQVDLGNGISAEVQVQPREVSEIFHDAHTIYDKWKRINKNEMTAEQYLNRKKDFVKMERIFDTSWEKYKKRNDKMKIDQEKNLHEISYYLNKLKPYFIQSSENSYETANNQPQE